MTGAPMLHLWPKAIAKKLAEDHPRITGAGTVHLERACVGPARNKRKKARAAMPALVVKAIANGKAMAERKRQIRLRKKGKAVR